MIIALLVLILAVLLFGAAAVRSVLLGGLALVVGLILLVWWNIPAKDELPTWVLASIKALDGVESADIHQDGTIHAWRAPGYDFPLKGMAGLVCAQLRINRAADRKVVMLANDPKSEVVFYDCPRF
ncbi:MAG: hypothetical protein HQL40_05905 [Alphaproteobacteria bacterium]|nr:hypothetical protein [Alphaproteobacteria bacterium]